ncbi:N-acetylneuraminate synthase [Pantoea sp. FN0305]|uniref:N-acetylneuraminate synthase n=1 Tax=Pantoea sp. FN0305 TaxID=3418559 RepID=UPI003CF96493
MIKIIAEAGVNHNGNKDIALKLIDAAADAGADVVKFQTFKAKNIVTEAARQADYQTKNTGKAESQLAMLERLELPYEVHLKLINKCVERNIEFLSTAFDNESLAFLVDDLKLKTLKIPSGELTNAPFVLKHAQTGCDLIVSTGMATLAEIEQALSVIAFGLLNDVSTLPSVKAFQEAYYSEKGQKLLKEKVMLLHCTTEYPAPFDEINLCAMDTLHQAFKLKVGYSDHSEGITIPIAATARGAVLIEKHFTLDKSMEGPDHQASLEPSELRAMVQAVRNTEIALGSGLKGPQPSEIKNKDIARKSLVAARDILQGEIINPKDIDIKRPGNGMSPYDFWSLCGKPSSQNYKKGMLFNE